MNTQPKVVAQCGSSAFHGAMAHAPSSLRSPLRGASVPLLLFLLCLLISNPASSGPKGGHGDDSTCPAYDPLTFAVPLATAATPSAGTLAGSFSVSPGGQASYRFPLLVPPGRLGMEPKLAVGYDSSAGEGSLGVGFALQGLSAVTRCPANLAQDGYILPVEYDERDHFCLDGLRLVPLPSSGAGGSTVEYRTFPDTFSRVVMVPGPAGPASFEVFTRSGHILDYGAAPNSRAMATGGTVAAWWLASESDRRGNEVDYTYENDADPGDGHTHEMLPSRIDYTKNGATAASRAVMFVYQDVPAVTVYTGGLAMTRSKLVHTIEMLLEGTPVRSYGFGYVHGPGTQRFVLASADECAGLAGPCKPATRFSWSGQPAGFTPTGTPEMIPAAQRAVALDLGLGGWVLADVNGDGLDDLVIWLQNTSDPTRDDWRVALNIGGTFAPSTLWATLPHPQTEDDSSCWNGPCEESYKLTPVDMDQDGNTDIFLDTPDAKASSWPHYRWLQAVPAQHRFVLVDTAIPQPDGVPYSPTKDVGLPGKIDDYRFTRLGDVDGDGVADLIQCVNPTFQGQGYSGRTQGNPIWTVNLWVPSVAGGGPGFDTTSIALPSTEGLSCYAGVAQAYVVDVDGAGGSEILLPTGVNHAYQALRYNHGGFEVIPTSLPAQETVEQPAARRLHFLDLNGDGLSDAIYTGVGTACPPDGCGGTLPLPGGYPGDVPFQVINDGKLFGAATGTLTTSLTEPQDGETDWYGDSAIPLDFNGDGRMDLMLPVFGHCHDGTAAPCWVVLVSSPAVKGVFGSATWLPSEASTAGSVMSPVDTLIPAPVFANTDGAPLHTFALPQVTDVNGDGRHNLVMPSPANDGTFAVYLNNGPQDVLTSIADGMNPLDPNEPGYVPTVSILYGNLVDTARTLGIPEDAGAESMTYLSRSDVNNDCAYPRACVVGPARVVGRYVVNNGQNQPRIFDVHYRDARYHRLGRGSLGFGERIVLDEDAGSGSAEFYDTTTWDSVLQTYPFDGQVVESWAWSPANASQATATQIEVSHGTTSLQELADNGGVTYFTLPQVTERTRIEGSYEAGPLLTLQEWVAGSSGWGNTTVLGDTTTTVVSHDDYGNVLVQEQATGGIDEVDTVTRSVVNDTADWLIGEVQVEQVCGASSLGILGGITQCRITNRNFNAYGEVDNSSTGDPTDPGTLLSVLYDRDAWGNVWRTRAEDGSGHHRQACVTYEPDGIFPYAVRNALGHTAYVSFDPGLGVKTASVDPNGLLTQWAHDGFGRVTEEIRPDGTWTLSSLARVKQGGPQGTWWSLQVGTQEEGGPLTATSFDGGGRPVRTVSFAAATPSCGASLCTPGLEVEQDRHYDLFGRLTRATVPWMKGDTLQGTYADTYGYDAAGRVTQHTEPWGRVTTFAYADNVTTATDWLGSTKTEVDALGRTVTVTDRNGGTTATRYGPFSVPWVVTRLGSESTYTTPDAYGRILYEQDPDRGATSTAFDGFGEVLTVDDALARHYAFTYDALGRRVERDDTVNGVTATTLWTYDTAANGIGLLATVTSPAGHLDTYGYDTLSRPSTHTLTLGDTGESFSSTRDYDALGRPWHLTYPAGPAGADPFVVARAYDAFGNLVAVQDARGDDLLAGRRPRRGRARHERGLRERGPRAPHVLAEQWSAPARGGRAGLVPHVPEGRRAEHLATRTISGCGWRAAADAVQAAGVGATESFQHDALDRLTCASVIAGPPRGDLRFPVAVRGADHVRAQRQHRRQGRRCAPTSTAIRATRTR